MTGHLMQRLAFRSSRGTHNPRRRAAGANVRRAGDWLPDFALENRTLMSGVPTYTTIFSSPQAPVLGQVVTLTAVVTVPTGNGMPTGTVTFKEGANVLGSASLVALNGVELATLPTGKLSVGTHRVVAEYAGGGGFAGSLSPEVRTTIIRAAGVGDYSGDNGLATNATLNQPRNVAVDNLGDIYIADTDNNVIRKVDHATHAITTIAGTGAYGAAGDNGPAIQAKLARPHGVAVDNAGHLFIADTENNEIRVVDLATKKITKFAGTGNPGALGDNGLALAAELNHPRGVAVDNFGNLFIADTDSREIRKVDVLTKAITRVAGDSTLGPGDLGDNKSALLARLSHVSAVAVDASGNLFIADTDNNLVREVVHATGTIVRVAGGGVSGYDGQTEPATAAQLVGPCGVAVDASGHLFIADTNHSEICAVDLATSTISAFAGNRDPGYGGDGAPAKAAQVDHPNGVFVDALGNVFIADTQSSLVRKVDSATKFISTVAGTRALRDGGPAANAVLYHPCDVAIDPAGNIFIVDESNNVIREVDHATGKIAVVAGNGKVGPCVDNVPATSTSFANPVAVAVDGSGHLFIADNGNNRIREVDLATKMITTVAGNGQVGDPLGSNGDNGPATDASLAGPFGVAVDKAGHLFIADTGHNKIRQVDLALHKIFPVAGSGDAGYFGDNGPAIAAHLNAPRSVAVDGSNGLFIADYGNDRVRKVDLSTHKITLVAGDGNFGYNGDGGLATAAQLNQPASVAVDARGRLFIADCWNNVIREVDLASGTIATVAGFDKTLKGVPANSAALHIPLGVEVDGAGNLFIADSYNDVLREVPLLKIDPAKTKTTLTSSVNPSAVGQPVTFTAVVTIAAPGNGVPTGVVVFKDFNTEIGSVVLVAPLKGDVTATFTTTFKFAGTHSITAVYLGNSREIGSTSAALSQVVSFGKWFPAAVSMTNASSVPQTSLVRPGESLRQGDLKIDAGMRSLPLSTPTARTAAVAVTATALGPASEPAPMDLRSSTEASTGAAVLVPIRKVAMTRPVVSSRAADVHDRGLVSLMDEPGLDHAVPSLRSRRHPAGSRGLSRVWKLRASRDLIDALDLPSTPSKHSGIAALNRAKPSS